MKTISIFTFPTHGTEKRTSGVDFVRMVQPMSHLNGYERKGYKFKVTVFDPKTDNKKNPLNWVNVAKHNDIIYLNYLPDAWGYAAMGAMARGNNRKIVLDLDDSLWDIKKDNPAYEVYHRGSVPLNNFTAMCNDVDFITCTNSYLKNVILHETYKRADQIRVFPNYVDFDLYNHVSPFKDTDRITLLHYGSTTHFIDLTTEKFGKGIDRIMKEYPNVYVKFVGAFIPKYRDRWGQRYLNDFGHEDIYKWIGDFFPKFMDEADILVAPLLDDRYNRCKSDIKRSEVATAKIPFVGQGIRQYKEVIEDGVDGMVCETEDDWYEKIKQLIDNPKLRKSMGEKAYKKIKKDRDIKNYIKDYADFFIKVLTNED